MPPQKLCGAVPDLPIRSGLKILTLLLDFHTYAAITYCTF